MTESIPVRNVHLSAVCKSGLYTVFSARVRPQPLPMDYESLLVLYGLSGSDALAPIPKKTIRLC